MGMDRLFDQRLCHRKKDLFIVVGSQNSSFISEAPFVPPGQQREVDGNPLMAAFRIITTLVHNPAQFSPVWLRITRWKSDAQWPIQAFHGESRNPKECVTLLIIG
jgi:hypothetical protein